MKVGNVYAIFKKEFRGYFDSPIAYIFIIIFLGLSGWLFIRGFFFIGQATLRGYFSFLPWLYLFFVPAITMRIWAEERKLGTIEVLMTFPVEPHEVVLGKYFAAFFLLTLTLLLSFPLPILVSSLGSPDRGPIIGGYVGAMLLGGAYLSIGVFTSSLTKNQIIAFILGVVICFALFIVGEDWILIAFPDFLVPILRYLGLGAHFDSILRGVIDTRDLIYYISLIGFFLYLNGKAVERRT